MNRRGLLKSVIGAALAPVILARGTEPIKGVGVLRYPEDQSYGGGRTVRQIAQDLGAEIRQGTIIAFPNTVDSEGRYLWDFRIEGGDSGQVRVERYEG